MKIAVPKEDPEKDKRIAMTPDVVAKLSKLNIEVGIEKNLGEYLGYSDKDFQEKGAQIYSNHKQLISEADIILHVRQPSLNEISLMKNKSIHISFLDPFNEKKIVEELKNKGISAISLEMMPRTTIAQKMDALSSQSNLAGYVAVILAAEKLKKIIPMMTTPSGTISPARVFVIGVGVAGLQAIATAKRLGARVEAFDVRPEVEDQVKSLGAKFIKIDLGQTGQTKDGYAKELKNEQIEKQKEQMTKVCKEADIVITTAQLFGRKAPLIIDQKIIDNMKTGSIIVDLAVESGGNVEGSKINKTVEKNGVSIIGQANLPGEVALDASQMFAMNLFNIIQHFWDKEKNCFSIDLSNDLLKSCLITHNNSIQNETIKQFYQKEV